jgi:ABC-type transporter Mla MlaB component
MKSSKSFNIKSSIDKSLNAQTLIFEGDLGMKNALGIKKTIQTLAINGDSVTMHLKSVEKLDITFIQTIRALRISLEKEGKKTDVISELPLEIERLLTNTGFDKRL